MTETAAATKPSEAVAPPAAPESLLAPATTETGKVQTMQTVETPAAAATETPSTETKSETPAAETVKAPEAPEKYTFTAPDGKEYDPTFVASFESAAKEAGLTQEAAQKVIEKLAPALAISQEQQFQATQNQWREQSIAQFGGDEAKVRENIAPARRFLDTFDPLPAVAKVENGIALTADGKPVTTPLRTMLDATGLANHPEVIRIMVAAGKAIGEDTFMGGKIGSKTKNDPLKALYPNTP